MRQAKLSKVGVMILEMELLSALSGLKTASDLTTRLRDALASRELKLDEAVARIIEIQCHISDVHTDLNNVQGQLHEKNTKVFQLEKEISRLKEQLAKKAQGRNHHHAAWKVLEDGTEEGPYCPNCWEQTGNFIQPRRGISNAEGYLMFFCGEHGASNFHFEVPSQLCGAQPSTKKSPAGTARLRSDYPSR
jgi:hypothetical protein